MLPGRQIRQILATALLLFVTDLAGQTSDRPAGTKSELRPPTFQVFPNPNAGKFKVTVKDVESGFDLNVYNLIGEMIYHWESVEQSQAVVEINLSKHPKGVYMIELDTEEQNLIKKVVIDHDK